MEARVRGGDRCSSRRLIRHQLDTPGPVARNAPVKSDRATVSADTSGRETSVGPATGIEPDGRFSVAQAPQLVQHRVQPQPLDVLHHVVMQPALFTDPEDRHDVGVVQACRRPRFPLEPLPLLQVGSQLLRQDLERHMPAQRDLLRLIHDAHAPAADLAQDAVVAQLLRVLNELLPKRRAGEEGRRGLAVGSDLLHHHQGGKQVADLFGMLGVARGIFGERRDAPHAGTARQILPPVVRPSHASASAFP